MAGRERMARAIRRTWLTTVLVCGGWACAPHPPPTTTARPGAVVVVDLTSRFLAFYDSAMTRHADTQTRWELWRRLYGFAAVPPTAFGQQLAQQLLDSAWARYPSALPVIRRGVAALGVSPEAILQRVIGVLACGDSVKVRLTVFVGGFEGNAFASGNRNGMSNIAVPVEAGDPVRSMTHEFAHAVHRDGCAMMQAGYGQSLAELVVTEGLAMRVVERLLPGHDADYYTAAAPGWLADAARRRVPLLTGIREHLADSGSAVTERFTFGSGTTGLSREAYYAGWEIVGGMVDQFGMTLHDIAMTPPNQYPALIRRVIEALISASPP